jgi:uridine kinase
MLNSSKSYIIGVAGGSGSGKSTAIKNITQVLQEKNYSLLSHDFYYKDQGGLPVKEREKINYDHPNSLDTDLLIKHLMDLRSGKSVKRPIYSFHTHTRDKKTVLVKPTQIILVDGILLFENKKLRDLFDLKIFVDTSSDVRFIRRLQRDIAERGRDLESVVEQYLTTVRPMYRDFVEPTKRYTDIIIPEGGRNWVALDLVLARVKHHLQSAK